MDIKTDRINQTLPLTMQIMRARAAEYYEAYITNPEASSPTYDNYTAWCVYDAAATLLAEAMDGNYEVLTQFIGDSQLPCILASPCEVCEQKETRQPGVLPACNYTRWAEWSSAVAQSDQDAAAARHRSDPEALELAIDPCSLCATCPADQVPGGRMACQAYRAYHYPSKSEATAQPICPCDLCVAHTDCPAEYVKDGRPTCMAYKAWQRATK